jgi:hypothetical protein
MWCVALGVTVAALWSCRQVAGLDGDFVEGSTSTGTAGTGGDGEGGAGLCPGCATEFCDPDQGCVDCIGNDGCTNSSTPVCIDGKCRECETSAQCPAMGEICYADYECGDACAGNNDCQGQQDCDLTTSGCVGCLTDGDCNMGSKPTCHPTRKKCVRCVVDSDCSGGRCRQHDNECVDCLVTTDCPPGEACVAQNCAAN